MASYINNLRKGFGKYPIGNSTPMKMLATEKLNTGIIIGAVAVGIVIGIIAANKYHSLKKHKVFKTPEKKDLNQLAHNIDGSYQKQAKINENPKKDLLSEYILKTDSKENNLNRGFLRRQKRKLRKRIIEASIKEEKNNREVKPL